MTHLNCIQSLEADSLHMKVRLHEVEHLSNNPGLEQSLVFTGCAIATQLNQLPAVQVVAKSLTQPVCQTPLILKRNEWIIMFRSSRQTSLPLTQLRRPS